MRKGEVHTELQQEYSEESEDLHGQEVTGN